MRYKTLSLLMAVLVLAGSSFLANAGEEKDKAAATDKKALQGTWNAVEGPKDMTLIFKDDTFTLKKKDDVYAAGKFMIDASQKPRTIDMKVTMASDKDADKFKDKTSLGIYEVDGDKLKWCANEPGKEGRPKEFAKKQGEGRYLYVTFERAKK